MAKIDLKLCMGTMCYVMGGAELCSMIDMLPDGIARRLHVTYSPCLGMCDKDKIGEPPYIELNGRPIGGVSKNSLLQILKEELGDAL